MPVCGKAKRPAVRPSVDYPTYGHELGAVKNPALRRLWRQGSIIRHCGSPTGIDYFSLAAGGVSARFMVAYTLSRAARESAFLLSSPSSSWLAWLAAASASFSSWSAVKNTALFMLRLPVVISVRPRFSQTNRAVRAATGSMQPGFDGPDRSYCSGSSIVPAWMRRRDPLHRGSARALPASRA